MNWIEGINWLNDNDKGFVLVTVLDVEGSAPREPQAKMAIWEDGIFDTIGGGNLEFQAIGHSRQLMTAGTTSISRKWITLGKDLSQCCGGRVELMFEYFPPRNFNLVLLGAGHVAQALVRILRDHDMRIQWVDSRPDVVETLSGQYRHSKRVQIKLTGQPELEIELAPRNTSYLIMTHSHELDMQYVEAILSRSEVRFCGLIGSQSKAAKFRNRLKRKGFSRKEIKRLVCPVGLTEIPGKKPEEVAVSVAAQIVQLKHTEFQTPEEPISLELIS